MNLTQAALSVWAPAFVLVLARVGAAMALLPGLGEAVAPAVVRIGLALSITILLLPDILPIMPSVPAAGLSMGLMVAGEVVTGLWFGWTARMIALALPVCAQFIGYLIGLSSVLQPDSELGAQSGALGKLFEMAAPVLLLVSGLYRLPVIALHGLFELIPPGHMLPVSDSTEYVVRAVSTGFNLALQLASPFVVVGIVWQVAMGLVARVASRMQIYFMSMPGQILAGLSLLVITGSAIILAWQDGAQAYFLALPGGR
ncbi:flagellar biosynthetic protein FliR [Rhodopila sp.]|uniref:flagellar biosynthetic protein FliR n=1 Tax=Rhodopila sp. TaxID=2480087 RepID=UPI003D1430EF